MTRQVKWITRLTSFGLVAGAVMVALLDGPLVRSMRGSLGTGDFYPQLFLPVALTVGLGIGLLLLARGRAGPLMTVYGVTFCIVLPAILRALETSEIAASVLLALLAALAAAGFLAIATSIRGSSKSEDAKALDAH
jgi:hypothetical protein